MKKTSKKRPTYLNLWFFFLCLLSMMTITYTLIPIITPEVRTIYSSFWYWLFFIILLSLVILFLSLWIINILKNKNIKRKALGSV